MSRALARRRHLSRLHTVAELITLFHRTGRWWLIPMLGVLLLAGLLLAVVQAMEYVAPFVYTIF